MKRIFFLLALSAAGCSAYLQYDKDDLPVGTIFDLDKYPQLEDDDDKRPFTKLEEDAIEYLQEYNQSRSFLAMLVPPACDFTEWMYPSCCATLEILDFPHEICIDMALEWRELKISLALNHNGELLFSFEFILGEICVGLPFMRKIGVCGHLYHLDVKVQPKIFLRACLTVKLKIMINAVEIRFYCLDAKQLTDGPLLQQSWALARTFENEPSDKGMIAILIKKDKVAIEFNSPIPKELVEAFKNFMNSAVERIGEAILVVKNAIVSAYNTVANAVATAASNAWRWCKGLFSWAG